MESDIEHDISLESLVISDNMTYIVSGTTTTNTITVSSGCSPTVWLNGVDIDVSAISDKSAFLIAEDSPGNVRIRIADNTANSLKSGTNKAGIEKSNSLGSEANMVGTLTIDGGLATNPNTGTLYAQGGLNAAGIGGGSQKSSGEIIINGGKLTTRSNGLNYNVGGGCAASIGGGGGGSLSPKYAKVTINGGYIDATTGSFSAVIGTGDWNANGSGIVAINGGYLYVNNQNGTTYNYYAIGGGFNSNGDVTITGGTIYNMNENPSYFIGASLVLVKNITGGSYNADVSQLLDATQYKCSYSVHSGLWTVLPNDMFILTCFMDGQYFESYGLQMGTSLDTIDEPEMAGYFFDGWYRNEGMTESISVMPSEDTVVYGAMIGKFIKLGEATDKSGYDYRYANASLKGDALTILNISVPTGYFKVTDTAVSGTQDYAAMTSAGVYSSTLSTSAQYKSLTLQGLFIDEDLQDFLRGLTFTMIPGVKQVVNASVFSNELNENMTVIVDPDGTAHYYEYFEGSISWEDAYNAAKTKRYNGLYGYLATITSSVEHDYIYKVLSGSGGWIGGMRVGNTYTGEYDTLTAGYNTGGSVSTSRYWYWTAGPEAGKRFFTQNISVGGGTNYTGDGLNYSNWNSGEPNAGGGTECYAQYGFGDSKLWNDLGTNYSGNIYGYYVEYSTYPIAGVVNEEEDKPFTATGFYGGSELILDADGGSVTPGSKEIVLGGVYGELPVPERAGYAFDGWFTTIGGSSQVSAETSVTDTDGRTVYAHWDLNAPSVTTGAGYSGIYDGYGHVISVVAGSQASVTYSYKWYKDGVLVAGEDGASLSLKNVADSGVYTCEVTISDGSDSASAVSGEITVAITKRPVTYKADDKSVTYNGLAHSGSSVSVTAGSTASGDSIGSVTFSGSFVNAGEYSIGIDSIVLVDGNDNNVNANYEFGFVGGTLTIGRKSITVASAVSPTVSKIYDGTVNGTSSVSPDDYTFVGLEAGDTLLLDFTAVFDGKNILGANKVTLSGLSLIDFGGLADNYDLETLTFDIAASILPATLDEFAANDDPRKIYDRTRFGVTTDIGFTGAIGSEQPVIKADLTFNSSSAGDGKTVSVNGFTLTWTGISEAQAEVNSNYVLAPSSDIVYNTGIIDPKPLTDSDIAAGLSFANADYTGGYITPSALITFGAYTLNQYTDYVVVYSDNVNAGAATTTVIGIGNYTGSLSLPFTIDSLDISETANIGLTGTYTYNGYQICPTAYILSAGGKLLVEGVDFGRSYGSNVNAGTGTIIFTFYGNYTGSKTLEFTIAKADISPMVSLDDRTFGMSPKTPVLSGNTGSGGVTYLYKAVGADDSTYTITVPSAAGDYVIKASVDATLNFNAADAVSEFSILKASFTPVVTIGDIQYGEPAGYPLLTGNVSGGEVSYFYKIKGSSDDSYSLVVPSASGTYTVKAVIAGTSDYEQAVALDDFVISKAILLVLASDESVSFGSGAPGYSAWMIGFVDGEDDSVLNGTLMFNCPYSAGSYVGTYGITPYGLTADNYDIHFVSGVLTVGKASVSKPTVTSTGLVYNGNTQSAGIASDSRYTIVGGEAVDAGDYTAVVSLVDSFNYEWADGSVSDILLDWTIAPKTVDVSWSYLDTYIYDGTDRSDSVTAWYYTVHGVKVDLNILFSGKSVQFRDAGEYQAAAEMISADPNYILSNSDKSLTVGKRDVTVKADSASKVYDGTALTDNGWSISGGSFVAGEGFETVTVEGSQLYVGSSANEISGYVLNGSTSAGNYNITLTDGTLTIEKASIEITVTADSDSKTYDGSALTDGGYTLTGDLALGDSETVSVSGTITNAGSADNTVGEVTIWHDGVDVTENYVITKVKGTLTVGKAQGSISDVSDIGKASDGTSVEDPDFTVVGDGEVTIEYFSGDDKLGSAPAIAGNYKVVITLLDGENYIGTKTFAEFAIEALKPKYKVEAGEGAPVISSGGLESLFGNPVDDASKGITQQELDEAEDIEITLISGKADISTADEELLKEFVGDNALGVLIDISLIKKVTYPGGDIIETGLTELSDVIEISIPIPQELKDKSPLKVYRIHDGVVSEFSLAPDENGEFYKIVGDEIIVYSRFFSTYAIGYEDDTSPQTSDDYGNIPMVATLISLISILSLGIVSVKRRKIQIV